MFKYGLSGVLLVLGLVACSGDPEPSENHQNEGGAGGEGSDPGPDRVERGRYLVDNVIACPDCHTPKDAMGAPMTDQYLAGAECLIKLPNGHCLHSRNLTNDETGLKNRTDAEIKKMMLDGVRPEATGDVALFPMMPYYVFHNMTDADADAIVAYLRTVPAVEHELPRKDIEFDLRAPAVPLDVDAIPMPMDDYPERAAALRGRYLATQSGACLECHTEHVMNDPKVLDYDKFFAGGEAFPIGLPVVPVSKNLTSDEETGLGKWSVEEIVAVLKQGVDAQGDGICPPMPTGPMAAYGGLTDEDATDIAHYLKSLPPIENLVDDQCTWPPMAP
jgi:mono/diheme cytochrome c family protein